MTPKGSLDEYFQEMEKGKLIIMLTAFNEHINEYPKTIKYKVIFDLFNPPWKNYPRLCLTTDWFGIYE